MVGQTHEYITNYRKCYVTSSESALFLLPDQNERQTPQRKCYLEYIDLAGERAFQVKRIMQNSQLVQEKVKSLAWLRTNWVRREESGNFGTRL